MRGFHRVRSRDDGNARVAPYESLLDLFTLISFILILTAFVHVSRSVGNAPNSSSVIAHVAKRGAGSPRTLPNDVVLMVLRKEDTKDMLTVVDGVVGTLTNVPITSANVNDVLNGMSAVLRRVSTINLGFYDSKERANPDILVSVQRHLATNGYPRYRIYFAGAQ